MQLKVDLMHLLYSYLNQSYISFFIFSEAVERLVEPPEVKHERLLPVSIAGKLSAATVFFVFLL